MTEPLSPVRRLLSCSLLLLALGPQGICQDPDRSLEDGQELELDQELEQLLAEEREESDRLRRTGNYAAARKLLNTHLRDDSADSRARLLLGLVLFDEGQLERAESNLTRVLADSTDPVLKRSAARALARLLHRAGRDAQAGDELLPLLLEAGVAHDARDLFVAAEVSYALGRPSQAQELYRKGAATDDSGDWRLMLSRARSLQRLGRLEQAGALLLSADALTRANAGRGEAPVLVALGDLFFEADREVEEGASRSASGAYDEALRINPSHEGALLGLYNVHRVNWLRQRRSAREFLAKMLLLRPDSVEAHLAAAGDSLRVGKLPQVRHQLALLGNLAPARREVLTLRAALAWVEHEREACNAILAELHAVDPADSRPEREVGKHLIDLYRFAEARPFLERAVERDSSDHRAWTYLANALANVGQEQAALKALHRSRKEGGLRQDAWRKNMTLVLERLATEYVVKDFGELSFAWMPDAAPVLEVYLEPFYREAREVLAGRYGYTPTPTRIEVFRRHQDFSVRSTGFEGFPALGVCFGPVVTALSPLAELRGNFSWARTSFHEFTHVIHLGLSHNRCPRWITEGLATWEEAANNPAWARNLRRELVDSYANGRIIPVRDLNAAFRGPRIIFGYYEGGLICEMLIEKHGFSPMIRLLEAFDRGLDLDAALRSVFDLTPEQLDRDLLARVKHKVAELRIEPRWDPAVLARKRFDLAAAPNAGGAPDKSWADEWCTQAWGAWQNGRRIDAEECLRRLRAEGQVPARALFLMGEMERQAGDLEHAAEFWQEGLAAGGEDFRVRILLGTWSQEAGDLESAEQHFLAAQEAFPGFEEVERSAEMKLVGLYIDSERRDDAMASAERYLRYDAGSYRWRRRVASWHLEAERFEAAALLLHEANEIDPFSRDLHLEWGYALERLERFEEALREYRVVALVPLALEASAKLPMTERELADLLGRRARCLCLLERFDEAHSLFEEAQRLPAEVLEDLPSLAEARELYAEAQAQKR